MPGPVSAAGTGEAADSGDTGAGAGSAVADAGATPDTAGSAGVTARGAAGTGAAPGADSADAVAGSGSGCAAGSAGVTARGAGVGSGSAASGAGAAPDSADAAGAEPGAGSAGATPGAGSADVGAAPGSTGVAAARGAGVGSDSADAVAARGAAGAEAESSGRSAEAPDPAGAAAVPGARVDSASGVAAVGSFVLVDSSRPGVGQSVMAMPPISPIVCRNPRPHTNAAQLNRCRSHAINTAESPGRATPPGQRANSAPRSASSPLRCSRCGTCGGRSPAFGMRRPNCTQKRTASPDPSSRPSANRLVDGAATPVGRKPPPQAACKSRFSSILHALPPRTGRQPSARPWYQASVESHTARRRAARAHALGQVGHRPAVVAAWFFQRD